MLRLIVLLAALFSVAYCQQTCDNILFQDRAGTFWADILYLDTPAPYNGDSRICSFHFQDGDPQCCSDVVYDIILNVWVRVRIQIAVAVTLAKRIREAWIDAREKFSPVRNSVEDAYRNNQITLQQRDALINFINRVLAAWDALIDRLIENWARCMTLVLKYWAGIICLGCDPEWDRYVYNNTQGELRLRLTVETCNQIRSGCLPVWQLVYDFITSLQEALNELRVDLNLEPVNYGNEQICNGDCGAWLCDVFFGGRNAQTDNSLPSPGTQKRNADKIEAIFSHFESQVTSHFHTHPSGPAFVESFSDLLWTTHRTFHAMEQVTRQAGGTATNEYGTVGLNPVEIGENSGLNTKVDASASGLSSWLHNLLQFL